MTDHTPFDYLLNAFEQASQHAEPATQGYASKRRALLDYVRGLEADRERIEYTLRWPRAVEFCPGLLGGPDAWAWYDAEGRMHADATWREAVDHSVAIEPAALAKREARMARRVSVTERGDTHGN